MFNFRSIGRKLWLVLIVFKGIVYRVVTFCSFIYSSFPILHSGAEILLFGIVQVGEIAQFD